MANSFITASIFSTIFFVSNGSSSLALPGCEFWWSTGDMKVVSNGSTSIGVFGIAEGPEEGLLSEIVIWENYRRISAGTRTTLCVWRHLLTTLSKLSAVVFLLQFHSCFRQTTESRFPAEQQFFLASRKAEAALRFIGISIEIQPRATYLPS